MTMTLPAPTTAEAPPTVERIRLRGSVEFDPHVLSALFGEMVRRAQPTLARYQSDLFHDARWMERHITGPATFWWVHREWGTHIGDDFAIMLPAVLNANQCDRMTAYRIDLTMESEGPWAPQRGTWFADFTVLYTTPPA